MYFHTHYNSINSFCAKRCPFCGNHHSYMTNHQLFLWIKIIIDYSSKLYFYSVISVQCYLYIKTRVAVLEKFQNHGSPKRATIGQDLGRPWPKYAYRIIPN